MSGNKSGANDARWEILRCLYAGEAGVLPLSAAEIAMVANCSKEEANQHVANWVIPGRSQLSQALEKVAQMRSNGTGLARQALELISNEINKLQTMEEEEPANELRLKVLLALTKSFQSLEEVINRMEKAIGNDERYPSDVLEFRQELEKYIQALGEDGEAE